jgi:hypothetical protein
VAGDGLLFECSVGLFVSATIPSPDSVLGDFTAASFTGYSALLAQTWGAPYLDSESQLQLTSPRLQWICTATGDAEVIRGYYVWREGTPDVLLFADQFDPPITITQLGDGLAFVVNFELNLSNHGTYLFTP